jgi:hypothetical protein
MRQTNSKSKSTKQTSRKRTPETIQLSTPAIARRILQLIYSGQKRENRALRQVVDELLWAHGNPLLTDKSEKVFERHFIKAAQKIEKDSTHARQPFYEGLQLALARLDAGETLAEIFKTYQIRGEDDEPALNLSFLSEHLNAKGTPASVCAFIWKFQDSSLVRAGVNASETMQASLTDAIKGIGEREALQLALKVAIETLARYAPAVSYAPWDYQEQAEQFAAAMSHHEAPEHFRNTFEAIYDSLLANKTNWSHPTMIRATYNAMCEYLNDDNYCGNVEGIQQSLLQLIETQLPAHVQEAIYNSKTKGGAQR